MTVFTAPTLERLEITLLSDIASAEHGSSGMQGTKLTWHDHGRRNQAISILAQITGVEDHVFDDAIREARDDNEYVNHVYSVTRKYLVDALDYARGGYLDDYDLGE